MHIEAFPPVMRRPFHAESNSRKVQIRADGKQVVYEYHGIIARDSRGRVFQGTNASPHVPREDGRSAVSISGGGSITDPIVKVLFRWNDRSKTVTKFALPPGQTLVTARPLDACEHESGGKRFNPNGETQSIDSLGERTIQGISTRGCRVSTLIPAKLFRNDQPFTIIDESWSSPELQITLLRVHHDPSGNDEITQLDNISLEEPDAQLFQFPQDYAIHDPEQEQIKREALQPPISHPELLAGPWETEPDASGGVEGMHLLLMINLRDSTEHLSTYHVGVYRRQGKTEQHNWFTANDGGGASWDGTELRINHDPRTANDVAYNLDLIFDQGQSVWSGTIARNGVSRSIRLKRPGGFAAPSKSPFVGEWYLHLNRSSPLRPGAFYESYCLHISQAADGSFTAWDDHKGGGISPYGSKLKVIMVEANSMTLTNETDQFAGGNVITYSLSLSPDGTRLEMKSSRGAPPKLLMKSTGEGFGTTANN
jgi:hypothetical protein